MGDYFLENITEEEFVSTFGDAEEYINRTHCSTEMHDNYTTLTIWRGMDHMKNISKSGIFKYDYTVKFDTYDGYINVSFYPENGLVPNKKHNIIFKLIGGIMHATKDFIRKKGCRVVSLVATDDKISKHLHELSKSKRTLSSNGWSFIKAMNIDDRRVYYFEKV